ncbi:penicillin-binding transpeptidase domain-containing protein [Sphingobacterium sp. T2]|uniref:penicillin-binding transpeptidase domain-containing protein n=1 Tax=Sphingobacterium sp. T2 TaxID=1590596 RepID=UPI0021D12864|nr:penicillin-binding transpeptidase domain-containing protein [Sphingobacterium sp. T2]
MSRAVSRGTATGARIPGIEMCGKTGTVQNPHGENHSVFFAFAPRENPKIAIAVFVENAGYGGTWAAPIASMIVEKYIRDTISMSKHVQDRIMNTNILPFKKKSTPEVKKTDKQDNNSKKDSTTANKQVAYQENKESNILVHHSQVRKNYAQR